jgi:hypothetical protein
MGPDGVHDGPFTGRPDRDVAAGRSGVADRAEQRIGGARRVAVAV